MIVNNNNKTVFYLPRYAVYRILLSIFLPAQVLRKINSGTLQSNNNNVGILNCLPLLLLGTGDTSFYK